MGRAFRIVSLRVCAWACLALAAAACAGPGAARGQRDEERPWFRDVTAAWGFEVPGPWPDGTYAAPEIMGPGVAMLDLDGDGDLDLIQPRVPPPGSPRAPAPNLVWIQVGPGRFEERGSELGLDDPGFAQGVAASDFNGDGFPDLYVANYGPDSLYLSRPGGPWEAASLPPSVTGDLWSSSAGACDLDRDGDVDLFVARYLRFDATMVCKGPSGADDYCDPRNFDGVPDRFLRNEGDGRFVDATEEAGFTPPLGGRRAKGLGVLCMDLTGDGFLDVYVANDGEPNHLWVRQPDGTFREEAALRGVAVNLDGRPEAGMGIAVADLDGGGRPALFLTHLFGETHTLYAPAADGLYVDVTGAWALAAPSLPWTGFGCAFLDADLDGDEDLLVVNGRVYRGNPVDGASGSAFWKDYAEPNQRFQRTGDRFHALARRGDPFSEPVEVSRGLAWGDLDGDGDPDVAVSHVDGSVRVYESLSSEQLGDGVRIRLGAPPARVLGARVRGQGWTRWALASGSYMSVSDPSIYVARHQVERGAIRVEWADGTCEQFTPAVQGPTWTVRAGDGRPCDEDAP